MIKITMDKVGGTKEEIIYRARTTEWGFDEKNLVPAVKHVVQFLKLERAAINEKMGKFPDVLVVKLMGEHNDASMLRKNDS